MKRTLQEVAGKVAFLYIQKNASTCISEGMRKRYGPRATNTHIGCANTWGKPLAVMWRHPGERLESAYRMFRERPDMAKDRNSKLPMADRMDFATFAMSVCRDWDDAGRDLHVATQAGQCTDNYGIFMPTKVYRWDFEAISRDSEIVLDRRNESNARIPTVWSPELTELHRAAYAVDWQHWEGVGPLTE